MPLLTDPDELTQGTDSGAITDLTFASAAGIAVTLTGTATLPAVADNDYIEVRGAAMTNNNGLYRVNDASPTTSAIICAKITGADPTTDGTNNAVSSVLGDTTTKKNIFFDTAANFIYLIEQTGLLAAGVDFNAIYSFAKEEWKDDNFLRQFTFPMFAVDLDAGKYQVGTDGANPNGWAFAADNTVDGTIRTKDLIRSGGWAEVDASGNTQKIYASIITLGTFEDSVTDNAYYRFGTDFEVDDNVNFKFAGPVNEAILCFEEIGNPATFTYVDGAGGNDSVTRASGSFLTDGFKVGGKIVTRASNTPANDGSYVILSVVALTIEVATASFNTAEADAVAQVSVDNRDAFGLKLRVRDGDTNGKTFDSSDLAAAGVAKLNNFIFRFPLANQTDLNITSTDVQIDANSDGAADVAPYTGMTITYGSSTTNRTGLVGGAFDFAITLDANGGTAIQVYEFVQWSLRSTGGDGTGDVDADADTAIGRSVGDLLAFEGDVLVSGGQLSENPSNAAVDKSLLRGVYITGIAAADQNNLRMVDDTGVRRQFPETISVTLDFNAALIDDTLAEYVLFFDRTIRTVSTDMVVVAGTGPVGTFTSGGAELPAAMDNDPNGYVRISGLTGADAAMNGIYQVTATTSASSWDVERYDGATIVTTTTGDTINIDEHPIDSPDAIIVDSDVPADVTGLASSDFNFAFDFDANVQGGRLVSTPTFVIARAIGLSGAQYVQSSVQTISSGTPLTIVLTSSGELNYVNV